MSSSYLVTHTPAPVPADQQTLDKDVATDAQGRPILTRGVAANTATPANTADVDSKGANVDYGTTLGTPPTGSYAGDLKHDSFYPQMQKTASTISGTPAPSESDVGKVSAWAQKDPKVQDLIDRAAEAAANGTAPPAASEYSDIIKSSSDSDKTDIGGSTQALIMFVFLQAKKELQLEKKDALKKIQKFSGMLDQLSKVFQDKIMPAQNALTEKVSAKPKDATTVHVPINMPTGIDLDNPEMDESGNVTGLRSMPTYDTKGKVVPEEREVNQQDLSSVIDLQKSWTTQVQQRMQQAQTKYQGLDQQDSTQSNILVALSKTYNDAYSGAARNLV